MKKSYLLPLCGLALILSLLMMLSGCQGVTPETEPEETRLESTSAEKELLTVFENKSTKYKIVWPNRPSDEEFIASNKLQKAFEACGVKIESIKDYMNKDGEPAPTEYEILIGKTNRPEGSDIIQTLKEDDYVVAVVSKKIIIAGGSHAATLKAAEKFISEYLAEGTSSLKLDSDILFSHKGDYPVSDFTINGVNITSFTIVRGAGANKIEQYAATLLADTIKERTGAGLKIIKDTDEPAEYEIRVGNTSRSGDGFGDYEYIIRADGKNIILGGGLYSVTAAVRAFLDTYLPKFSVTAVDANIGESAKAVNTKSAPLPSEPTLAGKRPVALCDQLNGTVTIIDLDAPDPTSQSAVIWEWKPTAELGFISNSGYNNYIDEAILRYSEIHKSYVICITSSSGYMAVAEYPSGKAIWYSVASGLGPHSIEYLPNGNVAVACSGNSDISNGCVRIYTASQGKYSSSYVSVSLPSAHGVVWDDKNEILWALGYDELVAFRITGTDSNPVLEKIDGLGGKLPANGGHNLSASGSDPDLLWISSGSVFLYSKSKGTFITSYDGKDMISTSSVKSVDSFADGTVIRAKATNVFKSHNTDTLTVVKPDKDGNMIKTDYVFSKRAFYKARRLSAAYSAEIN